LHSELLFTLQVKMYIAMNLNSIRFTPYISDAKSFSFKGSHCQMALHLQAT